MNEMSGPLTRVLMRYAGAALLTKAGLSIDATDPDLLTLAEFFIGSGIAIISEAWWYIARKNGWGQ
jgi:hypothetical protein